MGIFKFTAYLYLVVAAFFVYDGILRIQAGDAPYVSFAIVAVCIFMFFFRKSQIKKFQNRR